MPQLSVYYGLHWDVKVSQRVDFSFFLIIEVELIYNVVLGSGVQQSDSVLFIYLFIYLFILFQILFPYSLLQYIEYSSLCYTVGLFGYLFYI